MTDPPATERATLLLTGATGFVGGALLETLRESDRIRCLVRDASKLDESDQIERVEADLLELASAEGAFDGIDEVYYLVHSMEPGASADYAERDRRAAENYVEIAGACGVRRTIYLGGVAGDGESSEHLESRNEVERTLADGSEELVSLRASMIVGAGSASFRTVVQLVDKLPVLALPDWSDRRSQPVAIADVVDALIAARKVEPGAYEIAGPDTLTFEEITEIVAEELGEKHRSVNVPLSNAAVEARLASAVVDADFEVLRPLMEGLESDLLVDDNALTPVFGVEPTPFREAAATAIAAMQE